MEKWKFLIKSVKASKWLLLFILIIGAAIRVVVFIQNRSLFLDEANLARNIAERNVWDLFQILDYQQFAPPLFSSLVKFSTLLFGNTEWALRLIPLLAGLAALVLFYRLARAILPAFPLRLIAVWIFAFHTPLLRYATECKQYSTDVFAVLLVIWLARWQASRPFTAKYAFAWALFGALLCWFSMPVVFILTAVGIYFGVLFFEERNKKALFRLSLSIGVWLLSFGSLFFLLLKNDAEGDYLQQFHDPFFLPLLPRDQEQWSQLGSLLLSLVRMFSGPTALALGVGILGLIIAWFSWIKERRSEGLLWVLPLLACLLASGLHYYSLISRLVLFLVPVLLLTCLYGWGVIWGKVRPWMQIIVFLLLVLMASLHTSYQYFRAPYQISESRPALQFVTAKAQAGDGIYLSKWAVPPYVFYTRHHAKSLIFPKIKSIVSTHNFSNDFARLNQEIGDSEQCWLVYTHLRSGIMTQDMESELARFRENGKVEEAFRTKGTVVWVWTLNAGSD